MSLSPNILKLQDYKCFYCSCDIIPSFPGQTAPLKDTATQDHIIPKSRVKKIVKDPSKGFPNNTVAACSQCNNERGDKAFINFYTEKRRDNQ